MTVFLGVDGGGTKTALCLVAGDGTVLADTVVRSCYYLTGPAGDEPRDVSFVAEVLAEGVTAVCAAAGTTPDRIAFAFFGLPGYGELTADVPALDAVPSTVLGHRRYRCGNDMVCGWAGSLGGEDGINVVAGTGSIAYGQWRGAQARAGGWGELFGDEGSGYWIAVRGLQLFSRMSDGRARPGPLHALMRRELGLAEDLDVIGLVLTRWGGRRDRVAGLAPIVVAAARAGDEQAATVLTDAGRELALLVAATRRRLLPDPSGAHQVVPVSCSGGVVAADEVRGPFGARLAELGRYDLRAARFTPVLGAALLAARLAGTPLSEEALARLPALEPAAP